MKTKFFALLVALLCISPTTFAQFSGSGSGTEADPYLIFNPIQLDQVRNFLNRDNVYFKLMADIDLEEYIAENYPAQGWLPIGTSSSPFLGYFDGNGKTITNLTINRPSLDYVGLFGYAKGKGNSAIKNISIECNIIGKDHVGGVVGCISLYSSTSTLKVSLTNVKVKGHINGAFYVGGLIGSAAGAQIENNYVECAIHGTTRVGGLVGYLDGKADCSSSTALVEIYATLECGGIVGHCRVGIISTCCVYGNLSGDSYVGGIAGTTTTNNKNQITNCYFHGNLSGDSYVGGICGTTDGEVFKNYSAANISGKNYVGGILGRSSSGVRLKSNVAINNYVIGLSDVGRIYGKIPSTNNVGQIGSSETNKALTTTKIIVNGVEQVCEDNLQNGQSVGQSVLKYKATYQGIEWDFTNIWEQQETESYPYFKRQVAPPALNSASSGQTTVSGQGVNGEVIRVKIGDETYQTTCSNNVWSITTAPLVAGSTITAFAGTGSATSYPVTTIVAYQGYGTEENPYEIYTAQELANIHGEGYYKLMNDIDISSINPWTPIGKNEIVIAHLDGGNHTISGLNIGTTESYQGLFAQCTGSNLKNINIQVASFNGGEYSGALVGKILNGKITNCQVSGNVKGKDYTGGLVGYANATYIGQCTVTGNVTGEKWVGGVAAYVGSCNFTQSQYQGNAYSATTNAIVGGLIGEASGVRVMECQSSGKASCPKESSIVGGLIGKSNSVVTNCYSTSEVSSVQNTGGLIGRNYRSVEYCYACGNVTSTNKAAGLVGYNDGTSAVVSNCCAMNPIINATASTGSAVRVIGGLANSAPTPGMDNYALKTMAVSVNGVAQKIYDDNLNGVAKTEDQLKQSSTFLSMGWDMSTIWGINENTSYPYLKCHTKFATITFQNYDGTILQSGDIMLGITPAYTGETPTKAANVQYTYTFKGWNPIVVPAASDAIYTAEFDSVVNKYLITFRNDDWTVLKSEEVEYGVMPIAPTTPTKESTAQYNYEFAGWTPEVAIVTQAATYTATYTSTLREYLVTFLNEDNTVISSKNYKYGETPVAPADPIKQNTAEYTYSFNGWDHAIAQVQGPQTYKATYTATKNSYTITWQDEDGSLIDQTTVEYGVVPTHTDPIKQNTAEYTYTFAGWTPVVVAVTGNATYKATFTATKNSYTITWQDENGSLIDQTTVEYGIVPTHANPTKQNTAEYTYTFAGWTPAVLSVTGNATYKAIFTATKNSYTITWQDENGSLIDQTIVEYGQIPAHADPVKLNTAEYTYTFAGWTPAVVGVTGNATYKATFTATKNKYLITFRNDDGTVLKSEEVEYGMLPIAPATPTKESTVQYNYEFAGWTPTVTLVSQAATYTATYNSSVREYLVTFLNDDNSIISMQSCKYGSYPTIPSTPTKNATAEYSYTFAGWTPVVVTVTGNATYKATFTATKNSYTITWQNEDGSLIDQTIVEYGQIPAHADPVKLNTAEYTYTFAGWTPAVVAVTGNATYKVTFTAAKNSYTITWQDENGSLIDQTIVEYGVVPTHAEPTKEATAEYSYTFAGWTPAVVAVTGDATYKTTFNATKNSYTITWLDGDGSLIDQTTVEYGGVPTHADPTKEATAEYSYTFTGWTPAVVAVTGDATYTAKYNSVVNIYTITVIAINGQVLGAGECQYGARIDLTAIPDEGYVFDQWSDGVKDNPRTITVTSDAEYTALFTSTEGVDNIYTSEPVQKVIIDQKVYILRGDKVYTLTGQEVK